MERLSKIFEIDYIPMYFSIEEYDELTIPIAQGSFFGKKHTEESRKKMSEATKLIPIISCPHCAKSGKPHVMKRWHFDNCKGK